MDRWPDWLKVMSKTLHLPDHLLLRKAESPRQPRPWSWDQYHMASTPGLLHLLAHWPTRGTPEEWAASAGHALDQLLGKALGGWEFTVPF